MIEERLNNLSILARENNITKLFSYKKYDQRLCSLKIIGEKSAIEVFQTVN